MVSCTLSILLLAAKLCASVVGWILLALSVALINASSGLTALWVLLTGVGFVLFMCMPVRWAYRWLARKSGSLEAGSPSAMMMTVTILMVLVSGFFTDIIGIHAIFVGRIHCAGIRIVLMLILGRLLGGVGHPTRKRLCYRARGEVRGSRRHTAAAHSEYLS